MSDRCYHHSNALGSYRRGGGVLAIPLGVGVAAFRRAGVTRPSLDRGVGVIAPFLPADKLLVEPVNK